MENKKKCKACKEEKELSDFYKDKKSNNGFSNKCKQCVKDKKPSPRLGTVKNYIFTEVFVECRGCGLSKDACYFPINPQRGKPYSKCNTCRKSNIPVIKKTIAERACKDCKVLKDIDAFYKSGNRYYTSCKTCCTKNRKEYQKEYYKKNSLKIINRRKVKREESPLIALKELLRANILKCIRKQRLIKNKFTEEILGCSWEEFKQHIESQFENWMSWENRGGFCEVLEPNCSWDLDHIIPISSATTEEELYLLNHWSNFQPLCSYKNRNIKRDNIYPVTNLELKVTTL